jgi:hypothetical protein
MEQSPRYDCLLSFLADQSQLWLMDISDPEQMGHFKENRKSVQMHVCYLKQLAIIVNLEFICLTYPIHS